jgi:hypothetical protein
VDTVRYSVPYRFVRDHVEVLVAEHAVEIFHGVVRVAEHRRSSEPHSRVLDPSHLDGLWKRAAAPPPASASALGAMGRSLADYEAVVEVRR